jgi:hypothetical protein
VEQRAKVGEIRQWLRPNGYTGQYHRFMVIDIKKSKLSEEIRCSIAYPNGIVQELWETDLFQDPDDPEDDEYSVCIEEVADEAQDGADQNSILQG